MEGWALVQLQSTGNVVAFYRACCFWFGLRACGAKRSLTAEQTRLHD